MAEQSYCLRCGGALAEAFLFDRTRLACGACGFILFENPKLVAGVVLVRDGEILLIRRGIEPRKGEWTFPAGYVDLGESVEEAAVREAKEETGADVRLDRLLGVYSRRGAPHVVVMFTGQLTGGGLNPGHEVFELAFFLPERFPRLAFEHDPRIFEDWLRLYRRAEKVKGRDEMAAIARGFREAGRTLVFTNGCFDLLHVGHIRYLTEARALGDALCVGLNSDRSVAAFKGSGRPIVPQEQRAEMLAALASVDYVVIFDEADPARLIGGIRPQVLVKGADWAEEAIVGRDLVEADGGRVVRIPLIEGASTTGMIERIVASETR
ncbi:MAG: D-glycero-beta-D-manno-heptose 1-phosphate adenylyltransferase [Deltaproteobacteria bacterium]|nr:D-glycero-beta-D-manno-heptose 1-phosphate adenylyltransferase [Deltaproteobacteria bacterium]